DATSAAATARSAVARARVPATPKLPGSEGSLGAQPVSIWGTISIAGLAMLVADASSDEDLRRTREALRALEPLGEAATKPLAFPPSTSPASGGATGGGTATLRLRLPLQIAIEAAKQFL